MNIEFLILVLDYYKVLTRRDFILEWVVAIIIGIGFYALNVNSNTMLEMIKTISSNSISLLGVLVGFSIAVITLLVTTNTPALEEIKQKNTTSKIGTKFVTIYDLFLINFCYSVVAEVIMTLVNFILPSVAQLIISPIILNIINAVDIILISHILLITMRNISTLYFVLIKK